MQLHCALIVGASALFIVSLVAYSFLSALCSMEYGVYLFFGMVQLTAALFVYFLLPETAGVPIEMVGTSLNKH